MFLSGEYALYLAPHGDALLQGLSSFLQSTQSLMLSVYNLDTGDYTTPHTNLVSISNTADAEWTQSLQVVNAAAQAHARSTGTGSVNGIKTFCMLSTNDTLVQAAAIGVRQWIAAENARRGNVDNITVYVDAIWAANITGTFLDYLPYLSDCPDAVDVMLLQDGSADTLNAQLALRASQLRPRAAIGLSAAIQLLNAPDMAQLAAGWIYEVHFTDITHLSAPLIHSTAQHSIALPAQLSSAQLTCGAHIPAVAAATMCRFRPTLPWCRRCLHWAASGSTHAILS